METPYVYPKQLTTLMLKLNQYLVSLLSTNPTTVTNYIIGIKISMHLVEEALAMSLGGVALFSSQI